MNHIIMAACPVGGCPALPPGVNEPVTIISGLVIVAIIVVTIVNIIRMFRKNAR